DEGNIFALVEVDKTDKKFLEGCRKLAAKRKLFSIVEPNRAVKICSWPSDGQPNDPDLQQQPQIFLHDAIYGHHILANHGVNLTGGGQSGVTIGSIDTGVESLENSGSDGFAATDFFSSQVLQGFNPATKGTTSFPFGNKDADISGQDTDPSLSGHGTFGAEIMAAATNNSYNGAGMLPGAKIDPVCVGTDKAGVPSGDSVSTFSVISGIQFLQKQKIVRFINISINGAPPFTFNTDQAYMQAASNFYHVRNGLVFNSAGNDFLEDPSQPYPTNIVVSAVDATGNLAAFSNYGHAVQLTGLGVDDGSTNAEGAFVMSSGTSFSCPSVTGIAAAIAAANPKLSNAQILSILFHNSIQGNPGGGIALGVPVGTNQFGYGYPNEGYCVRAVFAKH
ncbi:MAG: S8 family peptidase, partial [Terriglobales bacterium]